MAALGNNKNYCLFIRWHLYKLSFSDPRHKSSGHSLNNFFFLFLSPSCRTSLYICVCLSLSHSIYLLYLTVSTPFSLPSPASAILTSTSRFDHTKGTLLWWYWCWCFCLGWNSTLWTRATPLSSILFDIHYTVIYLFVLTL